jgi:hypothetical protein
MSERFIKFIPSEEADYLLLNKFNAFRLLTIIAMRARREPGHPDGLLPGQCHIGDWETMGMSEQNYRTAKKILVNRKHIKIIETNRTRKKSTTGTTTTGTLVELLSLTVYDINKSVDNDRANDCLTTDQRRTRKNKKEKEYIPSAIASEMESIFFNYFKKNFPDLSEPDRQSWCRSFDVMIHGKKRTKEQINDLLTWLPSCDFWFSQIINPGILGVHFDRLLAQMQKLSKPKVGENQYADL